MIKPIKTLSGHSGCRLNLYKDGDRVFLRKDAGCVAYNRRLKKQFIKQKMFRLSQVKTPKIYNYGLDKNGIFYFDMEYINGIALSEYMNRIKIKEIVDLITLLFNALPTEKSKYLSKTNEIFQKKITELSKKLSSKSVQALNALNLLKNYDFSRVPWTDCCGDLTLENIIISSTGIYVIDLLDSFYNSWMIDIAKLLQDVELGWSYRKATRDFGLNLRLATAKQALIENILALPNGKEALQLIYHILLLNVLRIYPYTKDKETLEFLDNATSQVMSAIQEMEEKI